MKNIRRDENAYMDADKFFILFFGDVFPMWLDYSPCQKMKWGDDIKSST